MRSHNQFNLKSLVILPCMLVPLNDKLLDKKPSTYMRSADKMNFHSDAEWVTDNFKRLVHPFSCFISGSLLYFMVWVLLAKKTNEMAFDNAKDLKVFLQAYISLMLFSTGGHSLHEYVYLFTLPAVHDHFHFMEGFEEMTLESLFFTGNEAPFNEALQKTIPYLHLVLQQKQIVQHLNSPMRLYPLRKPKTEGNEKNCLEKDCEASLSGCVLN